MKAICKNITEQAKKAIKEYSKIAIIPNGLIKLLQPSDVSVNKTFKNLIRNLW